MLPSCSSCFPCPTPGWLGTPGQEKRAFFSQVPVPAQPTGGFESFQGTGAAAISLCGSVKRNPPALYRAAFAIPPNYGY